MGVRIIKDVNRVPDILRELKYLETHAIQVGVFAEEGQFMLTLAGVHEFGMTITPKNGQWLTIPSPVVKDGETAKDFKGLFRPKLANGELGRVLARKTESGFEVMFYLVESVEIPERSFLRWTFDNRQVELEELAVKGIMGVLAGKTTAKTLLETLGAWLQGQVQDRIVDISDPPNAEITKARKKSSNPLIDTGRLKDSITYRVVSA